MLAKCVGRIGQVPDDRRKRTDSLLTAYLTALRRGKVSDVECSNDDAREQLGLLQLVLYYVSFVVAKHELWSGQGNTVRDGSAWSHRVTGRLYPCTERTVSSNGERCELTTTVLATTSKHLI